MAWEISDPVGSRWNRGQIIRNPIKHFITCLFYKNFFFNSHNFLIIYLQKLNYKFLIILHDVIHFILYAFTFLIMVCHNWWVKLSHKTVKHTTYENGFLGCDVWLAFSKSKFPYIDPTTTSLSANYCWKLITSSSLVPCHANPSPPLPYPLSFFLSLSHPKWIHINFRSQRFSLLHCIKKLHNNK